LFVSKPKLVGQVVGTVDRQRDVDQVHRRLLQHAALRFVEPLVEIQHQAEHVLLRVRQRRDVVLVDDADGDIEQVGAAALHDRS